MKLGFPESGDEIMYERSWGGAARWKSPSKIYRYEIIMDRLEENYLDGPFSDLVKLVEDCLPAGFSFNDVIITSCDYQEHYYGPSYPKYYLLLKTLESDAQYSCRMQELQNEINQALIKEKHDQEESDKKEKEAYEKLKKKFDP